VPDEREVLNQLLKEWLADSGQALPPAKTWVLLRSYVKRRLEKGYLRGREDLVDDAMSRVEGGKFVRRKPLIARLRQEYDSDPVREPISFLATLVNNDALDVLRRDARWVRPRLRTEDDEEDGRSDDALQPVTDPTPYPRRPDHIPRDVHRTLKDLSALAHVQSLLDAKEQGTAKKLRVAAAHLKRDLDLGPARLRWTSSVEAPDGQVRAWQARYYAFTLEHDDEVDARAYTDADEIPKNTVNKARYDQFCQHYKRFREAWQAGKALGLSWSARSRRNWSPAVHATLGDEP
jgi:hypothetical protein